jgi:hypothetical protein
MTIAVTIENQDDKRSIVVEEYQIDKARMVKSLSTGLVLRPRERRTFYVHLLKDLHIKEKEP